MWRMKHLTVVPALLLAASDWSDADRAIRKGVGRGGRLDSARLRLLRRGGRRGVDYAPSGIIRSPASRPRATRFFAAMPSKVGLGHVYKKTVFREYPTRPSPR
jgi:hypothetical protein